jgi:O-antigen/teichoic acid export membrane protein
MIKTLSPQGRRDQRRRPPRVRGVIYGARPRRPPARHARARTRLRRQGTAAPGRHALGLPRARGGVRKAGFIVLVGSGLGAGVSFLATPFISRLFEPAVYGRFALITGVVSVFVGVSTFRLEVQSLRVADDAEAAGLIRLGLLASCAWGAALTLAACIAVVLWDVDGFWLSTGILVFLASLQLLGSAVLTRSRKYRSLAVANFVQGASQGVIQLLLGLVSAAAGSLLAGFGVARLGWLPALRRSQREMPGIASLWEGNWRFAALAGSCAFLNSLTGSLPVLLTSAFYGDAAVGQLAIGIRILVAPLSIVGQAAAAANIGEVGRMLRRGDNGAAQVVRHGMRDLLAVGLIPCSAAGVLGTWAVPYLLGKKWQEAGLLLALLAAGALAQFVAAPFSQLLNMTGNNRLQLMWDTGRLLATMLSISVPWALGLSSGWAIGSWSVALVVVYGASTRLCIRAVLKYQGHPATRTSARPTVAPSHSGLVPERAGRHHLDIS